ncbi:MAG: hypothetical protein ABI091_28725, partial [Ferruginibacter sp.]
MKKLYLMFLLPVLFASAVTAATKISNAVTGDWSSGASWVGGVPPGSGDDVNIVDGAVITADGVQSALTITIGGGTSGKLIVSSSTAILSTFGTISVLGGATLQVDDGILNIGNANGHRLDYRTGSIITINGGTVNLASRMTSANDYGIIYTQTGGTFNVNTVENSSTGFASFDIRNADNSTFNMSGGAIVLQNAGDGGSGPRDYNNNAVIKNITGGTVQVGNALSVLAQTYFLQGVTPNLLITNNILGHTARLLNNLSVTLGATINSGSTLALDDGSGNGFLFDLKGATLVNNGTLDGTVTGSSLDFFGTAPQVYSGSGTVTAPLANMAVDFGGGVTLNPSLPVDFTVAGLGMFFGNIITGPSTLVIGTSPTNAGTLNYSFGTIIGKIKRWIPTSTGATLFPVGIVGTTRPASINFTAAPTTGGTLTAEWISVGGGSNG